MPDCQAAQRLDGAEVDNHRRLPRPLPDVRRRVERGREGDTRVVDEDVQVPERGEGFPEKLLRPGRLCEIGLERLCPLAKLFR